MSKRPGNLEIALEPDLVAGQMVMAGFEGATLPADIEQALIQGRLSGVILFSRNFENPEQLRLLTDSIREASALPPLIVIDQEGGRVQRLPQPFTQWPSMRRLGEKGDSKAARRLAGAMAAELGAVGINCNLAPVLDVDSNPDNPVIGDRSLSYDPQLVARLGAALIEGMTGAGVISCAKHFPGHGDASMDSHLDLPVVEADRATLERRELVPFAQAIQSRVPMIMTAHLKAIALDPYYPATISRGVLHELLRDEMGYEGVIITDDLEMGALSKYMPVSDAAYSAARAGADLLLVCSGGDRAEEARQAVVEGLKLGAINFGEAVASVRRVLALKEEFLMKGPPSSDEIDKVVGCEGHQALAGGFV